MSMERRSQHNLGLKRHTHSSYKGGASGQKQESFAQAKGNLNWKMRISLKAQDKACVFTNLMKHINIDTLREAFLAQDGSKALGMDRVSKDEYSKNLEENLETLARKVANGSYRPTAKREVLIPKDNGKTRPIAIASFEDKLVDWCLGQILTQVYEPVFIRNSFGYRPGKSAHQAVEACYYTLEKGKRPHVLEIDFSNFFNNIPHRKLIRVLQKRIADKRLIGLVWRLLGSDVLKSTGELGRTVVGTPQGGIASPVLANIYLNEVLDQWFVKNYASYNNIIVRYADDAVFFFKDKDVLGKFKRELEQRVKEFGLELNEEKTREITLDKRSHEQFSFLGFTFYQGKQASRRILKVKTQKEKHLKAIREFYQWAKKVRSRMKLTYLWKIARAKIQGYVNYFGYWMNALKVGHYIFEAKKSLFKWLNRRSQKLSYSWSGFVEREKNFPLVGQLEEIKWKQLGNNFGRIKQW